MPHFVEIKKKLKADILEALDKAGRLDFKKTVAEFSLSTGFTDKTIYKVLEQMKELEYIEIDDNVIKRPGDTEKAGGA